MPVGCVLDVDVTLTLKVMAVPVLKEVPFSGRGDGEDRSRQCSGSVQEDRIGTVYGIVMKHQVGCACAPRRRLEHDADFATDGPPTW